MVLALGDEKVHLLPVDGAFSSRDLVVFFEKRRVLMLGGLFYNELHPPLNSQRGLSAKKWVRFLRNLSSQFPEEIKTLVPHEGDLCGIGKVESFVSYLEKLSDPSVEFAQCRKVFDWKEIPSHTSLEENFDFLRSR